MNTSKYLFAAVAAVCLGLPGLSAVAGEKHDDKPFATPKGGRLLEKTDPHAELVIEKDRSVTIHFYGNDMKPVPVAGQTVTVIAEAREGKQTLEFEKKGDALASKSKLPPGEGYTVVVQFRQTADARPQNFRFTLDTRVCGDCKRAEYACTCGH